MNATQSVFHNLKTKLFRSEIVKDSAIVSIGTGLGYIVKFLTLTLLARSLGPAQFGLFSICISLIVLTYRLTKWLDIGAVRFIALYTKQNNLNEAHSILKSFLQTKVFACILIISIGSLISRPLAVHILDKPVLEDLLKVAFWGGAFLILINFVLTTYQAKKQFFKYAASHTFFNTVIFFFILIFFILRKPTLSQCVMLWTGSLFTASLCLFLVLPKEFLKVNDKGMNRLSQLLHFAKWQIIIFISSNFLSSNIQIFFLSHFKSPQVVGAYSAAFNLASILALVSAPLSVTLLPHVCSFTTKGEVVNYIKNVIKYGGIILILLFLISLILAGPVILLIYGEDYSGAIPIFKILIGAFLCLFLFTYLSQIFYLLGIHNILAGVWSLELLVGIVSFLFLIPKYGGIGVASSILLAYIIGLLILIPILTKVVSNLPEKAIVKTSLHSSDIIDT